MDEPANHILNESLFGLIVTPNRLDISSVQVSVLFVTDDEYYGSQRN